MSGADLVNAAYLGDERDGIYIDIDERSDGWYVVATVDSETGHFTDALPDDGPYTSRADAVMGALNLGLGWIADNQVAIADDDLARARALLNQR